MRLLTLRQAAFKMCRGAGATPSKICGGMSCSSGKKHLAAQRQIGMRGGVGIAPYSRIIVKGGDASVSTSSGLTAIAGVK